MKASMREVDRAAHIIMAGDVKRKHNEDSATFVRRAVGAVRAADTRVRRDRRKAKREARKANR